MEVSSSPQLDAVGEENPNSNATILNPKQTIQNRTKTTLKPVESIHGEPTLTFTMEERQAFAIEEGLHQEIILKLSQGAPELKALRSVMPKHFGTKGNCLIGLLAPRQVLMRFDLYTDFVQALSRPVNHIQVNGVEHQIRIFPWSIGYNPEETTKAVVWISLPNLSPDLFAKQSLLSIASAIGKPIAIDKETQIKSRPSTARVKVILDLMEKLLNRVRLQFKDTKSGKMVEFFQEIVYDNLPDYCNKCKHQGHDVTSCRLTLKRDQNGKQLNDGSEYVVRGNVQIEKYRGDAREIIKGKRMAAVAGNVGIAGQKIDALVSAGFAADGVIAVLQQGNDQNQNRGEPGTVISGNDHHTNNGKDGDQLIAKVAIIDPKQNVSNVPALDGNDTVEMICTDDRLGHQLVAGIDNGTTVDLEKNSSADVVTASTNAYVVKMDGQTNEKEQVNVSKPIGNGGMQNQFSIRQDGNTRKKGKYGNSKDPNAGIQNNNLGKKVRGVDKGKEVLVYREKMNPTLPINKPTGIRICEPNVPTSTTCAEGVPLRNGDSLKNANAENNEIKNNAADVNRLQQNLTDPADTPGSNECTFLEYC